MCNHNHDVCSEVAGLYWHPGAATGSKSNTGISMKPGADMHHLHNDCVSHPLHFHGPGIKCQGSNYLCVLLFTRVYSSHTILINPPFSMTLRQLHSNAIFIIVWQIPYYCIQKQCKSWNQCLRSIKCKVMNISLLYILFPCLFCISQNVVCLFIGSLFTRNT